MSNRDLGFKKGNNEITNNNEKKINVFLISIIIAVVSATSTYILLTNKFNRVFEELGLNQTILQSDLKESATSEDAYDNLLMNLKQIRQRIDTEFVGDIDEKELVQHAIKGYVNGLNDDYSEYYTPEEWAEYKENLDGEFYGIGIYMTTNDDKNTVVVSTIKNTPAEKAGLKEGDILYKVDDEEVLGVDINIVSKKIKGPENTKVKLTLIRKGKEIEEEIIRKKVTVVNVESKILEDKIGYILIESFDSHVSNDFEKALKELQEKGMERLILDLRNNTGGDVNETIKILDYFIPKKSVLFYTKDSKENEKSELANDDNELNIPIILLGNKYSASASEILISALIDNDKAKFIGENTYGKGVIQTVFETSNAAALKLTTMEYFRANKEKIHEIGIKPDIEVKIDETKKDKNNNIVDSQLNRAIVEVKKIKK